MVPHAHDHLGLPDLGTAWPHACVPETFAETFAEAAAETACGRVFYRVKCLF